MFCMLLVPCTSAAAAFLLLPFLPILLDEG